MNLAILGPQGSGKGTQAELLISKFGFTHVETGKILRQISESDHSLASQIKQTLMEGKLVSDDILEQILTEKLSQPANFGYLFDGTPRNLAQYDLLKYLLSLLDQKFDHMIFISLSESETIHRLSARRTCSLCNKIYNLLTNPPPQPDFCECGGKLIQRTDDTPEGIKKRLEMFASSTLPVISKAAEEKILITVNGEQSIQVIHQKIVSKLGL